MGLDGLLSVLGRVTVAIPGGYGLMALWTAYLARVLSQSRLEATVTASLLSFALGIGWVVYVFAARSARRGAVVLAAGATLPALGLLAMGGR